MSQQSAFLRTLSSKFFVAILHIFEVDKKVLEFDRRLVLLSRHRFATLSFGRLWITSKDNHVKNIDGIGHRYAHCERTSLA